MRFGSDVHSAWPSLLLAGLSAAAIILAGGCDNTIEPFSESGSYSVYGVLYTDQDVQFIRVMPLAVPVTKVDSGHLQDATVTLENVTEGRSEVLADSILLYEDATSEIVTHNFWTDTPIKKETKYRLTVEGDAGTVESTTLTPTATDAPIEPQEGDCREKYTVFYEGVDDLRRIEARVELKLKERFIPDNLPPSRLDGDWFLASQKVFRGEGGEVISIFQPGDILLENGIVGPALPDTLNPFCWSANPCGALATDEVRVRYTYLGAEWYGDIPQDSLVFNPLRSFDVSGGLGFFGSARRDRSSTRTDTSRFVFTGGLFCDQEPPGS